MTRVGRKPQGWKLIDHLSGDDDCKARLKAFLQTMTGQCTVPEACRELGIKQSRFFVLRNDWLQEVLNLLEPKPVGRPRKTAPEEPQVAQLKQRVQQLEQRLMAAELRSRLAAGEITKSTPRDVRKKGARR